MQVYQSVKIFISSPGDVDKERELAEDVIQRINRSSKDMLGIILETINWKHLLPETPNLAEKTIQDVLTEKVREANIFLLILNKRYGSIEKGRTISNTQIEVESAIELLLKKKKLTFLSYFKKLETPATPDEQEKKVRELRKNLQKKGIWFRQYTESDEFEREFTHDLYQTILKYLFSTLKYKALSGFWQLGVTDKNVLPELAIIYPPVDRSFMRKDDPDIFWHERLLPNVVFEDSKAMQKIEKSLRIIRFRNFRFYSTYEIPSHVRDMNRVWLCLPRNIRALKQLANYETISKFQFNARTGDKESRILWRESLNTDSFIKIKSPLSQYLNIQRKIAGGQWKDEYGKIIAKDYGIIARFNDYRNKELMISGTLKDYFIAGIRGLGTWGAGWFIDRKYDVFSNYDAIEEENIQILIEVIYINGRVYDVRDVSNEPAIYFKNQNESSMIQEEIKKYQEGYF